MWSWDLSVVDTKSKYKKKIDIFKTESKKRKKKRNPRIRKIHECNRNKKKGKKTTSLCYLPTVFLIKSAIVKKDEQKISHFLFQRKCCLVWCLLFKKMEQSSLIKSREIWFIAHSAFFLFFFFIFKDLCHSRKTMTCASFKKKTRYKEYV